MKTNNFGEIVYNEDDLCDLVMQGRDITTIQGITIDVSTNIELVAKIMERPEALLSWKWPEDETTPLAQYDAINQGRWFMPDEYKNLDIAEYVLSLCTTQEQLQRVGQELLLFQERELFGLLRYLKYLVDVMTENHVIWGVGRGSSVASYVLYLLGVHKIDSMFYDLDPHEFLR